MTTLRRPLIAARDPSPVETAMSPPSDETRRRSPRWRRRLRRLRHSARNVGEILSKGRLGQPYSAEFEVVQIGANHRLRRYVARGEQRVTQPVLLVPPLMVTSEVYDISPEVSAVSWLSERGVDVWLVDFGAPERVAGGMERTLDDHVLAVDSALDTIRDLTGADIHLAGYSQGGLFVYQAAAYRRGRDIASLITFGSPVDIRRNLPVPVHEAIAGRVLAGLRRAIDAPLDAVDGLPGLLTSSGFKLLGLRKEIKQIGDFFTNLHDRSALEAREPRRRFLGGEGFVAWPGPALRTFVDEVVTANRMAKGGFVINGRTVTLADVRCPILYFVGLNDELARPASVRSIRQAAPHAPATEIQVAAGHFGLVVGSRSLTVTWPAVLDWMRWLDGGARPEFVDGQDAPARPVGADDAPPVRRALEAVWDSLGKLSLRLGDSLDVARYQVPRLTRLQGLDEDDRISIGRTLAEQAARIPERTFFIWRDRAFTYAEADAQVTRAASVLASLGVARGLRVGVFMSNRPSFLTSVAALSRLGAVAVLLHADARGTTLEHMLRVSGTRHVITDPARAGHLPVELLDRLWVTGRLEHGDTLPEGAVHLNPLIERAVGRLPDDVEPDAGRGRDLALLMFTSGTTGMPRAARVTNQRWTALGLASAAACRLMPLDTVYCCLPLHHSTAMFAAVGGAMLGGSRLALAPRFDADGFWTDVRRSGATVVFYVGEICRYLTNAPVRPNEHHHPVRLFAGNGMRADVWRRLVDRFRPERVLEFYSSTEGNAVLVNLTGSRIGSVGRPFTHLGGEVVLVRWSHRDRAFVRGRDGRLQRCRAGEPGVLLSRIVEGDPIAHFGGYTDGEATDARIVRDAFEPGDLWYNSGDLMRFDHEGDFWFVDRVGDSFKLAGEHVSTEQVERVLHRIDDIAMAVVAGVDHDDLGGRVTTAIVQLAEGVETLDGEALFQTVCAHLSPAARPRLVHVVERLELNESFQRIKHALPAALLADAVTYEYAEPSATYRPIDVSTRTTQASEPPEGVAST